MKLTFKKVHTSPPYSIAYILQDEKELGFNFMVYTTDKVEAIVKLKKMAIEQLERSIKDYDFQIKKFENTKRKALKDIKYVEKFRSY